MLMSAILPCLGAVVGALVALTVVAAVDPRVVVGRAVEATAVVLTISDVVVSVEVSVEVSGKAPGRVSACVSTCEPPSDTPDASETVSQPESNNRIPAKSEHGITRYLFNFPSTFLGLTFYYFFNPRVPCGARRHPGVPPRAAIFMPSGVRRRGEASLLRLPLKPYVFSTLPRSARYRGRLYSCSDNRLLPAAGSCPRLSLVV